MLKLAVVGTVLRVTTPVDDTLTKLSVYPACVAKVNACPSGSVAVSVVIIEPLVVNSAILN